MLESLNDLHGPLFYSLQYIRVSLVLGRLEPDPGLQLWPYQC